MKRNNWGEHPKVYTIFRGMLGLIMLCDLLYAEGSGPEFIVTHLAGMDLISAHGVSARSHAAKGEEPSTGVLLQLRPDADSTFVPWAAYDL